MKNDNTTEAWKKRALEAEAGKASLSRQLIRELRVLQILVAVDVLKPDQLEKARQIVDDLGN